MDQKMPKDPLQIIKQRIDNGDREGARTNLAHLVQKNPDNILAWEMLASLLDDPIRQADCYHKILKLDPGNQLAAEKLAEINDPKTGEVQTGETFKAPQNNGEADTPPGMIISEMQLLTQIAKDVREIGVQLKKRGIQLSDYQIQALTDRGYISLTDDIQSIFSIVVQLFQDTPISQDTFSARMGSLSTREMIEIAGAPLAPEERRSCPHCSAVVSRTENKCPWCSFDLSQSDHP